MRRQLAYLVLVPILCMSLLGYSGSAQAQTLPATPTPTATLAATPLATAPADIAENHVTFAQIGVGELNLVGPFDRTYLTFSLPGDWKLKDGAELDLALGVSITRSTVSLAGGASADSLPPVIISGGTLTVQLNDVILADIPLTQDGELPVNIKLPLEAFTPVRNDGNMLLTLTLNSDTSCEIYNDQLDLVIRSGSSFTLPHELVLPDTSLANFPRPIIQGSFLPDSALFVLPDQPAAADLQAALTISAGLGNISTQNLLTNLTTLSKLTAEQKASGHIILIGKAASLPLLAQLPLPLPLSGGKFQTTPGGPDDGVVQMINSPWSKAGVILLVSGNNDQGTIRAAQAVSTGALRPNSAPNLSIIDTVQSNVSQVFLPVDQTLADLGYEIRTFESRGLNTTTYRFSIPPGWVVAPDAHLELVYGHSKLLNYERSGLVVLLNGQPIGSARFSDLTGDKATNAAQIMIPASIVRPGPNQLEVRANIEPLHRCSPRNMRGMWVTVWSDSRLHLPVNQSPLTPGALNDLAAYPAPFTFSSSLSDTAFVLPKNDLQSWNAAMQIAAQLGDSANGPISMPAAFFADQVPAAERAKYNLLVIGRPAQLPIVTEINELLPAPFATGSEAADESSFQVTYRIPLDSPSGYVQLLTSPWNPDKVVLAVLGKLPDGLGWAVSALTVSNMRSQMAGNFAVAINAKQLKSTDTRVSPLTSGSLAATETPVAQAATTALPATQPVASAAQSSSWILPVLGISLVLLVILVIAVFLPGSKPRGRK